MGRSSVVSNIKEVLMCRAVNRVKMEYYSRSMSFTSSQQKIKTVVIEVSLIWQLMWVYQNFLPATKPRL